MDDVSNQNESIGYLKVNVSTARGAIPLADAAVRIRGGEKDTSGILYSVRTDRDGQTERIALPTPPRFASESPGGTLPYAIYSIDVSKDGYIPLSFHQVPVFPSVTSIQPAVMVPKSEYAEAVPPVSEFASAPPAGESGSDEYTETGKETP